MTTELELAEVHEDFIVKRKRLKGYRPPKYNSNSIPAEMKFDAIKLAREEGYDDKSIALELGISFDKFLGVLTKDPVLRARIVVARDDHHIATVEESLYQRAKGYDTVRTVRKIKDIKDEEGNVVGEELKTVKEIFEALPAEVSAIKEFLHNRAPERWAAKTQDDSGGRQPITIQIVNYGSDTDPSAIQILTQTVPVAISESDAAGGKEGCVDLAPTNGKRQNLP
jgi:hypothetical protein